MSDNTDKGSDGIKSRIKKVDPVLLAYGVMAILLAAILIANGINTHYKNDRAQDAKITALQSQIGVPVAVDGITWAVTALSGSGANNVVIQITTRAADGTTSVSKIGVTDGTGSAISRDWRAVSTPTPVNSANSFIVWRDGDGNFHCKVQ